MSKGSHAKLECAVQENDQLVEQRRRQTTDNRSRPLTIAS